jgi:hypothetical protein
MLTTEAGRPLDPFTIHFDQSVLDDLVARPKATSFAPDLDDDERYGLSTTYLGRRSNTGPRLDWRAMERKIDGFARHRVDVGGSPADAFDVIVASLPGFAFSTPLSHTSRRTCSMVKRSHPASTIHQSGCSPGF